MNIHTKCQSNSLKFKLNAIKSRKLTAWSAKSIKPVLDTQHANRKPQTYDQERGIKKKKKKKKERKNERERKREVR